MVVLIIEGFSITYSKEQIPIYVFVEESIKYMYVRTVQNNYMFLANEKTAHHQVGTTKGNELWET